ncbi:hypothetical protein [Streptomyces purpureus]|uniref:hypothetical protein n=1 Tax=Streptomyces purpureus TaxID=1951 RepID=UPI00037F1773|nr:hypothetical protein [Streptomyces purpureus]
MSEPLDDGSLPWAGYVAPRARSTWEDVLLGRTPALKALARCAEETATAIPRNVKTVRRDVAIVLDATGKVIGYQPVGSGEFPAPPDVDVDDADRGYDDRGIPSPVVDEDGAVYLPYGS